MTRGLAVAIALLVVGARTGSTQIIDSRAAGRGQPIAWTSLSVGWLQQGGLCDPDSNSCWDFGSAPQFRATLEMPIGRGAALGIAGTTARVPLSYQGGLLSGCTQCDADANVSQVFGNFRMGGEGGFHQVIDVNAGMTLFSNFRSTNGSRLDPSRMVSSLSFAIGYGFGYGMTERLQIMVVQDYGVVIHKRFEGEPNNTAQQAVLRLGARYGLGSRRRGY